MNEPSPLPNFLDTDLRKAGEAPPKKGFVITTYIYSNMRYKTHKTHKTKKVQTLVLLDTQSTGNFVTREYLAKGIPYIDLGQVSCDVTTITGTSELRTMQVLLSPIVMGKKLQIVAEVVEKIGGPPVVCPKVNDHLPFTAYVDYNHRCESGNRTPDLLLHAGFKNHWMTGPISHFEHHPGLSVTRTREGYIFSGSIETHCSCTDCQKEGYQILCRSINTKTDTRTLNQNIVKIMENENFAGDAIDNLTASDSEALRKLKESIEFVPGVVDHEGALGSYQIGQI